MEVSNSVNTSTVLLIIFIVLKLTGNINWSWVWVLSPFWIPLGILIIIFSIITIIDM